MSKAPEGQTYIADLWEQPTLCLALFGIQFHTEEGQRLYEQSGIQEEMMASLEAASADGLLLNRPMMSPEGPLLLQYWRSHDDLNRWSRQMPHTRWWRWLLENMDRGLGFYHEIYQVKAGEAIYERGTQAVGPALFLPPRRSKPGKAAPESASSVI